MTTVAFDLLAFMLTAYVMLDGYDLGIATIAPLIARTSDERAEAMHAIGPYWNGNEVWIIAAGGALFALFPKAYASIFSGFYLPFIVVLWLLMFRGMAMELRGHFPSPMWRDFWDFCFTASSALLVLLFGVTLGNLVRGVPLDHAGYFIGTFSLLLNPFAFAAGALAVVVLAMHGALFAMPRVSARPAARARTIVAWAAPAAFVLYLAVTVEAFSIVGARLVASPWVLLPIIGIGILVGETIAAVRGRAVIAFAFSCAFLTSLLIGAAAAMYPYVLPGFPLRAAGLSIATSSPSPVALFTALAVSIAGVCIVVAYSVLVAWALPKAPSNHRRPEQ